MNLARGTHSFAQTYVKLRRSFGLVDLAVLLAIGALMYGIIAVGKEWQGTLRPVVEIDLSPWSLPRYAFFSLTRGFAAYVLSLSFTLVYGYVAAYNAKAERFMLPALDILQSIPVLGFLPTLVLAFITIFPHSNIGLELAAVVMMFTGQVWNMTFSFYNSLKSIPNDLREAGSISRLGWWQRFTKLELPFSSIGLIWNSMMSMAGGWFFLTINESFVLGEHDFRLPGIGSYMSVAIQQGNIPAMIAAIIAMTTMIVTVDQLFWRPIVAWSQKYKVEETTSEQIHSFVLDFLHRSHLLRFFGEQITRPIGKRIGSILGGVGSSGERRVETGGMRRYTGWFVSAFLIVAVAAGMWKSFFLLSGVNLHEWFIIGRNVLFTLGRVLAAIVLGTSLMIPLGVVIGLNPRLSRLLQPIVQVVASFPAPMLFPLVILGLSALGIGINIGAIALMLLGTQWYILFNVIAGAMAIPHDLREAAIVSRLGRWKTWRLLILPGIFPSLVTGWVTAAGGAWNASIVAEYVHFGKENLIAEGLGSMITTATDAGNYGVLAASVLVMTASVVLINRLFWKRLYHMAEQRFSLNV